MEIVINYWAVFVCGVVSMIIGFIWYGPIFGKTWMKVNNISPDDAAKRAEMQKSSGPLYIVSFVLSLFQAYVLAYYIAGWQDATGVENALWIWAAFLIPTVAASSMWTNDSGKVKWTKFLIQSGYYLVLFVVFGLILGMWK